MCPVSRRRKKKGNPQRSAPAIRPEHLSQGPTTPDYALVERTMRGPDSPPEVQLLGALLDAWQQLAQGMPARHCIHAVSAIQSVLDTWGVFAEPVTVSALVKWPNGYTVEVGDQNPAWLPDGGWSGHLGLWLPGLERFIDPSLYQANRPQAPTMITRGVILPIEPNRLGMYAFPKDGAIVRYAMVDDPGPSWRTGMPANGRKEIDKTVQAYGSLLGAHLATPPLQAIRAGLTHGPLVNALAPGAGEGTG